ncbi:uncharacterized protein PAC_07542 [Phialocephala subalpina]|uniref:Uncharacterized protein n=1 Tax=Phialocephala subalpina TaxID=576137 RepID=A0A1L7WY07_9HELO|nr:uncharacterized protein PAC_07542 [Phialocephala subalpina]
MENRENRIGDGGEAACICGAQLGPAVRIIGVCDGHLTDNYQNADVDHACTDQEATLSISLPPKTNSWTMAENVYVLELVELKVWDLNRTLNKTDFEEIARGMEKKFGGHIVGVGQKLATALGKQEMFAQSSWYYPSRNSNSLHSYVTRKGGVWEHKYIQILNHYLH